jgi:hypothetical protein
MGWIVLIAAALVVAYLGRSFYKQGDEIRKFRDHIEAAREEAERERPAE